MKTNLFRKESTRCFIYRSEKEFPKYEEEQLPHEAIREWLSAAEKVEVYKGEEHKFERFIFIEYKFLALQAASEIDRLFEQALKEGIIIPEDCFLIGPFEHDGKMYAYFRPVKQQEPQVIEQTENFLHLRSETVPDWVIKFDKLGEAIRNKMLAEYSPEDNKEPQEELWKDVVSIINRDVGEQFEYDAMGLLKANFEIKRKDK